MNYKKGYNDNIINEWLNYIKFFYIIINNYNNIYSYLYNSEYILYEYNF